MSCCNFGSNRDGLLGGFCRSNSRLNDRRDCRPVNWGHCRDNRFCPGRGPDRDTGRPGRRGQRRPYWF